MKGIEKADEIVREKVGELYRVYLEVRNLDLDELLETLYEADAYRIDRSLAKAVWHLQDAYYDLCDACDVYPF